jgi:hypothetical protein
MAAVWLHKRTIDHAAHLMALLWGAFLKTLLLK